MKKLDLYSTESIDSIDIQSMEDVKQIVQALFKEFLKNLFANGVTPNQQDYRIMLEFTRSISDIQKFIESKGYTELMVQLEKELQRRKRPRGTKK